MNSQNYTSEKKKSYFLTKNSYKLKEKRAWFYVYKIINDSNLCNHKNVYLLIDVYVDYAKYNAIYYILMIFNLPPK